MLRDSFRPLRNRHVRLPRNLAVAIAAASLALSACGIKGPLKPAPAASTTPKPPATAVPAPNAPAPAQEAPPPVEPRTAPKT